MIRAHLATFPPRAGILMQAVNSILPQVDRLCICLNGYDRVPEELGDLPKVQAMIPETDLKDAGKFAFPVGSDDLVFTIDDDIRFPPDYVARVLKTLDHIGAEQNVVSHLGHAFVLKGATGRPGWKNYAFNRRVPQLFKVDLVGTGVSCQLGRHLPGLDEMIGAAGFVDMRHARLHQSAGRTLWVHPHDDAEIVSLMTDALYDGSLFKTVHLARHPAMRAELQRLYSVLTPFSGLKWDKVQRERAAQPLAQR